MTFIPPNPRTSARGARLSRSDALPVAPSAPQPTPPRADPSPAEVHRAMLVPRTRWWIGNARQPRPSLLLPMLALLALTAGLVASVIIALGAVSSEDQRTTQPPTVTALRSPT